jgi:hypothetical protein
MDVSRGIGRIYTLAKRVMLIGPLAGISIWLSLFLSTGSESIAQGLFLVAFPLAIGGVIWLIAWIVEGFASPEQSRVERA